MPRGALIGVAGDGLALTAGILNAAQMRHANEPQANYRFSMQPDSRAVVNRLYQQISAGEYPIPEEADELARIAFEMDFPDRLGRRLFGGFGKKPANAQAFELEFGLVPVTDLGDRWAPSPAGWRRLLDCHLFAALVEIPSLTARATKPWPGDDATAEWLSGRKGKAKVAAVIFLLPGPPPAPAKAKGGEAPKPLIPPANETQARLQLGTPLFESFLPRTSGALGPSSATVQPFFLWVESKDAGGVRRINRRQLLEAGGYEPEYPYDEARALIDHLGSLSG